jgi:mono/diheme cytochrome c family protein
MKEYLCVVVLMLALITNVRAGGIPSNDQNLSIRGEGDGHWLAPEKASKRKNPIPGNSASIQRGKDLFILNCASCHGKGAEGNGSAAAVLTPKPANLKKMSGTHPDGDLAWKIENGRGPMPAWKNILSQDQIWDLVNYIQSLSASDKVRHDDSH